MRYVSVVLVLPFALLWCVGAVGLASRGRPVLALIAGLAAVVSAFFAGVAWGESDE